jgi:lipoprotein-anchoring transpeptidase ErfK/SrfK
MRRLATILVLGAVGCLGPANAGASTAAPEPIAPPSIKNGATTARVVIPSKVLSAPGTGQVIWYARTVTDWSKQEQTLPVLGQATYEGGHWLQVLLPIRPNGTKAWIPRDHVALEHTPYWIVIDKSTRNLRAYRWGELVRRTRVVIGAPRTPTPGGLTAIYEISRQRNPKEFLGSWVLSLTALSDVLQEFDGAPGRIGIHGRGGESLKDPLGTARSHGCVRMPNWPVAWLARHVPQGTPVRIQR